MDLVGDRPARVGVISIDLATGNGLVLSTKSSSGRFFCLSLRGGQALGGTPSGGTVDAYRATSIADCSGRDWLSGP